MLYRHYTVLISYKIDYYNTIDINLNRNLVTLLLNFIEFLNYYILYIVYRYKLLLFVSFFVMKFSGASHSLLFYFKCAKNC